MDIRARDIMTREVLVVKAEDKVEKAARILLENKISGIPVVDEEDRVIGIISEKDLIIKAGELKVPFYITLLTASSFWKILCALIIILRNIPHPRLKMP